MRGLLALKWTRCLNKSLFNNVIIEQKCVHYRVINEPFHCRNNRCYSTELVNNTNNSERWTVIDRCIVNSRKFSITNVLSKSKDKEKKKKSGKTQQIDENELSQVINIEQLTTNLEKCVIDLKSNFVKHLTLRSSTGAIEQLPVTFDGQEYLLQELVQIARKPKTVILNVTSFPQAIPQVLDAISKSGMNLNPQQDGTTIFIPVPKVTKEHRENLSKNAKVYYIKCRDSLKDIRNKEIKNLKKKPSLSEDDARRIQSQIEMFSDRYIKEAETILENKQNELVGSSD